MQSSLMRPFFYIFGFLNIDLVKKKIYLFLSILFIKARLMLAVTYTDVGLYLEYAYLRFLVNLNNAEYAPIVLDFSDTRSTMHMHIG